MNEDTGKCQHGVPYRSVCEQCREETYQSIAEEGQRQLNVLVDNMSNVVDKFFVAADEMLTTLDNMVLDACCGCERAEEPPVHECIHGVNFDSLCTKCMNIEGWMSTCETCNGEGARTITINNMVTVGKTCVDCKGTGYNVKPI